MQCKQKEALLCCTVPSWGILWLRETCGFRWDLQIQWESAVEGYCTYISWLKVSVSAGEAVAICFPCAYPSLAICCRIQGRVLAKTVLSADSLQSLLCSVIHFIAKDVWYSWKISVVLHRSVAQHPRRSTDGSVSLQTQISLYEHGSPPLLLEAWAHAALLWYLESPVGLWHRRVEKSCFGWEFGIGQDYLQVAQQMWELSLDWCHTDCLWRVSQKTVPLGRGMKELQCDSPMEAVCLPACGFLYCMRMCALKCLK